MSITKESQAQTPFQAQSQPVSTTKRASKKRDSAFHGVRKRTWGRYVSEIRLPGQKTRIWLGSFESAEMAARAYDSAAYFLKGSLANLNFPEEIDFLPRPISSARRDIQLAAAKAAHQPSRSRHQQEDVLTITHSSSNETKMNENENGNNINSTNNNIDIDHHDVNDFPIEMMEWWKEEEYATTTSFWDMKDAPLMSPPRVGSTFGDMMTWNEVLNFNDDILAMVQGSNSLVYVP